MKKTFLGKCVTFSRIFDKKLKLGEIDFTSKRRRCQYPRTPFSKPRNDKGKWQVLMVSAVERDKDETLSKWLMDTESVQIKEFL